MNPVKYLLIFILIILAQSLCRNPDEQVGQCTQCSPIQVLIQGSCFPRMRGCLQYLPNGNCKVCQFGYVLMDQSCIREAEFNNNTDLTPAPIIPDNLQALKLEEIKNILGNLYGSKFPYVHEYFLQKYPRIGSGEISSVQSLPMKTGDVFNFIYVNQQQKYKAIAIIDELNQVQEIFFDKTGSNNKANIVELIQFIRDTVGSRISQHFLYAITKTKQNYLIDFMNEGLEVIRAIVPNPTLFIKDPLQLAVSISLADLQLKDLAKQQLYKKFRILEQRAVLKIETVGKFIVIFFDKIGEQPPVSVSIRFKDYRFMINTPFQQLKDDNVSIDTGYLQFRDTTDPRYLASLAFIVSEFPILSDANVLRVKSQLFDGINFLFTFYHSATNSRYQIKVFYNFKGEVTLLEVYKGNNEIFTFLHNYNRDTTFLESYPTAIELSNVINVPEIVIVSRKIDGDYLIYKVSYTIDQHLRFKVNNKTKEVEIIEYFLDGSDILGNPLLRRLSSVELLEYLNVEKPETLSGKISSISFSLPFYSIRLVLSTGTYVAMLEDNGQQLNLVEYNKISNQICFQMSIVEIQSDSSLQQIDKHLRSIYPLGIFQIQLVQIQVLPESLFKYRIVYSNPKLQQIQIYLQFKSEQQIIVTKASLLNFGFEIEEISDTNNNYQIALSQIKKEQNKEIIPFFTESNSNFIRTYYETGDKTVELTINRQTNDTFLFIVSDKSYISLPPNFQFQNLIVPEVVGVFHPASVKTTMMKIVDETTTRYSYYIQNPVIKYAQIQDRQTFKLYTILIKTDRGYIRIASEVKNEQENQTRKLISLVITGYVDRDFSTCDRFTEDGVCNQCPHKHILYQNSCFEKMEGCLIQPGNECVKCDSSYIEEQYRCYRDCGTLF